MDKIEYIVAIPKKLNRILGKLSRIEGETKGEVIRRSIALYDYILKEVERGKKILIINDKEGWEREIIFK